MRFITPLLCLSIALISNLSAEGTREVAPNSSISVVGNETTDIAALHINHPNYNNFASYSNNDPHSRLYINIQDPSRECIYLGFSFGHFNETSTSPSRKDYQYRIKDPAGNVVFGPVAIPLTGGNILNWQQAFAGPMEIHGAAGYDAHEVTSTSLTSQGWSGAGDYYVEFLAEDQADILIDFWDITVADCSFAIPTEKKGRVWSYNWSFFAINDFGFPNRPFNGAFYVCAPDPDAADAAFITKIDFNGSGFRPAAFNVAFNSFGSMNTGNIAQDRRSVQNQNSTQSEYAIFLNDPVELCETAVVGEIALHGISRCDASSYCIKFTASKAGQVEVLLDFDGPDDIFTPFTRDVVIVVDVLPEQVGVATCVEWDGLDGMGNPVPELAGSTIPITLSFAQGIYHFPIYDAEFMTNGFNLQAIRPAASVPLLYYDDSNIDTPSGSGEPTVQLTGCTVPCHRWTNFPNPNTAGFGNLNTINSWWFSQRIVRNEVLLLPAFYTCEVDGPQSICQGGTTQITINPLVQPAGIQGPAILSANWSGPGIIGSSTEHTITIGAEGTYVVDIVWVTDLGDTCTASCDYELVMDPPLTETIDTLIVQGDVLVINSEEYTEAGQYFQFLTNSFGCDSILTINVKVLQSIVYYSLNACLSFLENGSHMDYSEFIATQPEPLSCADIAASIVFREPVETQKHSCTPGVNNSIAMCISSLDTCDYDPGNDASLIFEMTITPDDTAVHVTGLSFFEKGPLTYDWINGPTGPNNYPTLYGLRILKNGVEIYRREDVPTSTVWTEQTYDFLNEAEFIIEEPATFRFELLPYCLIGNGADVNAWDLDEISVTASCAPFEGINQIISGIIKTPKGVAVPNVEVILDAVSQVTQHKETKTDVEGGFLFEEVLEGSECQISAYKNTDFMNGVSTLDLIYIQKHLLGKKPFDSPYQFIAADANKSNSVSAKDLIELRKLILGMITQLPNNTSWRFGTAHESYSGTHPWGFKETVDIEYLLYDYHNADFTAVKIGDLNGDVKAYRGQPSVLPRSNETFDLKLSDQSISSDGTMKVEIRAADAGSLHGFQFALAFDGITIKDIQSGKLKISSEHFEILENEIRISWSHHDAVQINADDVLFSLIVDADKNTSLSNALGLASTSLIPEAYMNENLETKNISFEFSSTQASATKSHLYQNEPNPFDQNTMVRFDMPETGIATLRILDLSGKIIEEISAEFLKGANSIELTTEQIGNVKGILLCQLQYGGGVETIKMVRM